MSPLTEELFKSKPHNLPYNIIRPYYTMDVCGGLVTEWLPSPANTNLIRNMNQQIKHFLMIDVTCRVTQNSSTTHGKLSGI